MTLPRFLVVVLALVAVALLVTEASMQPSAGERVALSAIYVGIAGFTVALHLALRRWCRSASSLRWTLIAVAVGAGVVVTLAVVVAAQTMFLSVHDRNLVLVAVALGAGLGIASAVAVANQTAVDLQRLSAAARQVAVGDLTARASIRRADELGRSGAAFDDMAASLAAIEEERRTLLASIGHDLRTPLASMRAVLDGLEDGVVEDTAAAMKHLSRDVDHLSHLVEDVFLFARMEAGTFELHPESLDLAELVDETAEAFGPLAARTGIAVESMAAGPVPTKADPWAMTRAVRNLTDNAIRHAESSVSLRVDADGGHPVIEVVDDGPGFPPELAAVAFERFVRGDPARTRSGGAGLGLAIARGIVEAHGGSISIEGGEGGCVRIRL